MRAHRSQEHKEHSDIHSSHSLEGDEYHSATAETIEEACKLVDAGFEYICEINGVQVFRKRK